MQVSSFNTKMPLKINALYVGATPFMDHITCEFACTSVAKNGAKLAPLCMMSYVKGR